MSSRLNGTLVKLHMKFLLLPFVDKFWAATLSR